MKRRSTVDRPTRRLESNEDRIARLRQSIKLALIDAHQLRGQWDRKSLRALRDAVRKVDLEAEILLEVME